MQGDGPQDENPSMDADVPDGPRDDGVLGDADVPPADADARPEVHGGLGSMGPRAWATGPVTVTDDGFEYVSDMQCAGSVCVTGGLVR